MVLYEEVQTIKFIFLELGCWFSALISDILVCAINPVLILVISQQVKGILPEQGFMVDPESGNIHSCSSDPVSAQGS